MKNLNNINIPKLLKDVMNENEEIETSGHEKAIEKMHYNLLTSLKSINDYYYKSNQVNINDLKYLNDDELIFQLRLIKNLIAMIHSR